ncbi:MAG: putative sugar kinase, partial [Acidimicrobiaceae bacterium]|nr:putative sugar kinase [Acidimicrobiaceae bacterium]
EVVTDRVRGELIATSTDSLDFAISFGGDGTVLRAVQATVGRGVPVLGVNMGRLGYLTQVEPDALEDSFDRLIAGRYEIDRRMTLSVTFEPSDGGPSRRFLALNEATLERISPGHTIRVAVEIDELPFLTYAADGLMVATPTGSTAYNLSARGPVVSPSMRLLVLTAISPHLLFDRSLVLGPEEEVRLAIQDGRVGALVVDGTPITSLEAGDIVRVRAADEDVPFVSFGRRNFHAVLRAKFSLADR